PPRRGRAPPRPRWARKPGRVRPPARAGARPCARTRRAPPPGTPRQPPPRRRRPPGRSPPQPPTPPRRHGHNRHAASATPAPNQPATMIVETFPPYLRKSLHEAVDRAEELGGGPTVGGALDGGPGGRVRGTLRRRAVA